MKNEDDNKYIALQFSLDISSFCKKANSVQKEKRKQCIYICFKLH